MRFIEIFTQFLVKNSANIYSSARFYYVCKWGEVLVGFHKMLIKFFNACICFRGDKTRKINGAKLVVSFSEQVYAWTVSDEAFHRQIDFFFVNCSHLLEARLRMKTKRRENL